MNFERFVGLQWRLSLVSLLPSAAGLGVVAIGYQLAISVGLAPTPALGVGLGAGLIAALASWLWGFSVVRQLKLRLWDAGDLALRISRGDFGARLTIAGNDELGVLEEQMNQMAGYLEQAVGQLRLLAEQNRSLAQEAGRGAALEERARLARDLHDTVNQQLFVLSLRAAAARKKLERLGGDGLAMLPELQALEQVAREAHTQTRELILQLRPTTLEQQGLGAALEEYIRAAAGRESWQVEAAIDPGIRLGGEAGEALFRVAQEALNNIAKHAKATHVAVALKRADGQIQLQLADNGVGFERRASANPTSVGLVGMQERMAGLGGQLRVRSKPGTGTEILATLPERSEGGERPS